MVTYADKYLLTWERHQRMVSEKWRSQARAELAATGTVPNERTMQEWKRRKDEQTRLEAQEKSQFEQLERQKAQLLAAEAGSLAAGSSAASSAE